MWGRRTEWPVDIEVRALADGIAAFVPSRWGGVNSASLEVNSANTGSDAEVRAIGPAIEHEVCHLAQSLYDPRNRWSAATASGPWYWLDEATATEFEYQRGTQLVAPGAPLPIPDTVTSNLGFVVAHSLEFPPGDFLKVRRHGYGAAAFIHSCIPHMGLGGLGALYTAHYYNPSYTPVRCLDDMLTTWSLDSAFVDFVDQWVRGTVYFGTQFPDASEVLAERINTPVLGTNQPTALFERKVGDLSIWPILLKRAETPPGSNARVFGRISGLADGEYTPLIFRYARAGGHGTLTRVNSVSLTPLRIDNFELGAGTLLVIVNHSLKAPYISTPTVTVGLQIQPSISGVMPAGGKPGTPVTIEGYGFGNSPGNVYLRGEQIDPTAWSGTSVDFVVPKLMGVASGSLTLEVRVPGPTAPDVPYVAAQKTFAYDSGI